MLAAVRGQVIPAIEKHGPVLYWIVDDSGMRKQGPHSVGVARQYCGNLGKVETCQVAVSLSLANDHASLPIVASVSAAGMGGGCQPAPKGGGATGYCLCNQADDRARAASPGAVGQRAGRRCAG